MFSVTQKVLSGLCLVPAAAAWAAGCNDSAVRLPADREPEPSLTDAAALDKDAGQSPSMRQFSIPFAVRVGDSDARCGAEYDLGTAGTPVELLDLRFYVSGLTLLTATGEATPLALVTNDFQSSDVALIDLEDGTASCKASGNAATNALVIGEAPDREYSALRFELGVPFELNHQDVSTAESPLNITNLFWSWLPGHKFVRIDLKPIPPADAGVAPPWNFHLGSTHCTQNLKDGGVLNPQAAPDRPCDHPNLPTIALGDFDPDRSTVVLDLGALFGGSDVSKNLAGDTPGCMSFPTDEADCLAIFSRVGLDYTTGRCDDECRGQSAFSVE